MQAQSIYSSLLHCTPKGQLPLTLFYARFFKYHQSFYDLEILNASVVKSYTIVLETDIYAKAISYYQETAEAGEVECKDMALEPVRRAVLDKAITTALAAYKTVPISMHAVPTLIKAPK